MGADASGKPKKWRYIFDIITKKYDFFQTTVQAKDVRDLCDYYEQTTKNDSSKMNVYELCLHYIKHHTNSHSILDEVPFFMVGMYILWDSFSFPVSNCNKVQLNYDKPKQTEFGLTHFYVL